MICRGEVLSQLLRPAVQVGEQIAEHVLQLSQQFELCWQFLRALESLLNFGDLLDVAFERGSIVAGSDDSREAVKSGQRSVVVLLQRLADEFPQDPHLLGAGRLLHLPVLLQRPDGIAELSQLSQELLVALEGASELGLAILLGCLGNFELLTQFDDPSLGLVITDTGGALQMLDLGLEVTLCAIEELLSLSDAFLCFLQRPLEVFDDLGPASLDL